MLEHDEFKRYDFFKPRDNFSMYKGIKTILISGIPSHKRLSVVIPAYKRAALLEEALISCLAQKTDDFNIIITDNEPSRNDETELLIKKMCHPDIIYYKNEKNIGPLANFNRCIEVSDCDYCIFLCSDDLLYKGYIRNVLGFISGNRDIDMLLPEKDIEYPSYTSKMMGYSMILRHLQKLVRRPLYVKLGIFDFLLYYPAGGPSGIVYKRSAFIRTGGFDPDLHPTGDYILHALMSMKGNVALTSFDSGSYRMISNISQEKDMRDIYIIQKYLFLDSFIASHPSYGWARCYFRGSVFYRLHRPKNKKTGTAYDSKCIRSVTGRSGPFHFACFLIIWLLSLSILPFRIKTGRTR